MSAEHWDSQAKTVKEAERAVWSEPGWDTGIVRSVQAIEQGISEAFEVAADVLEIGCGVGRVTHPLALRWPSTRFHGQDISPAMLEHASINSPSNITWWLDELPGCRLDVVYSMLVFQHLPAATVRAYFAKISRHLNSGGVFRFQFVEGSYAVDHDHRHKIGDIVAWLNEHGFEVIAIDAHLVHQNWTWVTAVKL